MPQVPAYQQTAPDVTPNERQLVAPDTASGTDALAGGLGKLGSATEDYAQAREQMFHAAATAQGTAQVLADREAAQGIQSQFETLKGNNAAQGQKAALDQLQAVRDAGIKATSGSQLMQKFYVQSSGMIYARAIAGINKHAQGEISGQIIDNSKAKLGMDQNDAVAAAGDPAAFPQHWASVGQSADALGRAQGLDGDGLEAFKRDTHGATLTGAIQSVMNADPLNGVDKAIALRNTYGGEENLNFGDRLKVDQMLKEPAIKRDASAGFTQITSELNGAGAPGLGGTPAANDTAGKAYIRPVEGAHITDDYAAHVKRGSMGVDYAAPLGASIHPIADGTVIRHGFDDKGGGGNFIVVDHGGGMISKYMHMSGFTAKDGDQVTQAMVLGTVGQTGDATGPHVHVQVLKNGVNVDAESLMGGKSGAAQVVGLPNTPRMWDQDKVLATIRGHTDWTPEKRDAVEAFAKQRFETDEHAINDGFGQAKNDAQTFVSNYQASHGGDMPAPNMIPHSIAARMSPKDVAEINANSVLDAKAKTDAEAKTQQQMTGLTLDQASHYTPDQFMHMNLPSYAGKVEFGTLKDLMDRQAKMVESAKAKVQTAQTWSPYGPVAKAYTLFKQQNPDIVPHTDPATIVDKVMRNQNLFVGRQQEAAILHDMTNAAYGISQGAPGKPGHIPTTAELMDIAKNTTRLNTFKSGAVAPMYSVKFENLSPASVQSLTADMARHGVPNPSHDQIAEWYRANNGLAQH